MTGVLPIALERMTRIVGYVMHSSKEYICVMQLHKPVDPEKLERTIREFQGVIYQRPPLRSSVKRSLRKKAVYKIELIEYDGKYALMRVDCEAGTYMRKLCWDIGLVLGVGAHMRELRRVRTGPFREDRGLVTLQDLSEAIYRYRVEGKDDLLRRYILPGEYLVCHLHKVVVRDSAVESIVHGAQLAVPGVAMITEGLRKGDRVALLTLKGELIGIGRAVMDQEEIESSRRGIAVRIERVILEPGIYPKMWKTRRRG